MDLTARLGCPGRILPRAGSLHLYKAAVDLETAGATPGPARSSPLSHLRTRPRTLGVAAGEREMIPAKKNAGVQDARQPAGSWIAELLLTSEHFSRLVCPLCWHAA